MRIALKADGGAKVGLGHLGRCAALAQAFVSRGHKPVFIDVPAGRETWIASLGLRIGPRGSRRWDVMILDSYRLTAAQLRSLRRQAGVLLVIDDFGNRAVPCDWILNSSLNSSALRLKAPPGTGLLLGTKFVPLRNEYWSPARNKTSSGRIKRLLFSLGGAPAPALFKRVLAAVSTALPDAEIHAVDAPPARSGEPRIIRHQRLSSLRPLIDRCDAAVSAGGQILYELAFMGTPAVAVELARNQAGNVRGMSDAGAVVDAGRPRDAGFERGLIRLLRKLDAQASLRSRMSEAGRRLVDGQGAVRVVSTILDAVGARLK